MRAGLFVPALCASAVAAACAAQPAAAAKILYAFSTDPRGPGYSMQWGLTADASGALYGTTIAGGPYNEGVIFKLTPPAAGQTEWAYSVISSGAYGPYNEWPPGNLLIGAQGQLYGTTQYSGTYGYGSVFSLTPPAAGQTAWTGQTLFSFDQTDGKIPVGLAADASGALYGVTVEGGSTTGSNNCYYGCGVVYKLTPPATGQTQWTETTLYQFAGSTDGAMPRPGILRGANGVLYGALNTGQVFALTPPTSAQGSWLEHTLYLFQPKNGGAGYSDGFDPNGELILDKTGALYGTTYSGGSSACQNYSCGLVFKLAPAAAGGVPWTKTTLFEFLNGSTGANPTYDGVVMDELGNLFGTTANGGSSCADGSHGVVYELSPPAPGQTTWTETLPAISTCAVGGGPPGPLVLGKNGVLYGSTSYNGPRGGGGGIHGPIPQRQREVATPQRDDETLAVCFQLRRFDDRSADVLEVRVVSLRTAIAFVAVLSGAGPAGAASYAIPYEFQPAPDGAAPHGALIAVGGVLYGTTYDGGSAAGKGVGTVFSFNPSTGAETVLSAFAGTAGGTHPAAGLTALGGLLYGTAEFGGAVEAACSAGCGTLFSVDPASGAKITLHTFTGSDGVYPAAPLLNLNGILYGTTEGGGSGGYGTVFSFDPATGVERVIYSFKNRPDGALPVGGLTYYGGRLYGTTQNAGSVGWGTLFAIDQRGHEQVLHSFSTGSDGGWPEAALTVVGSTLYGTTAIGGGGANCSNGCGTVFSYNPASGTETVLHAFQGLDGDNPTASLLAFQGSLVGTTQAGGTANSGTVFSLVPATGVMTTVHSFTGRPGHDGAQPAAALIDVNNTLYGTAETGGVPAYDTTGGGTIFTLTP